MWWACADRSRHRRRRGRRRPTPRPVVGRKSRPRHRPPLDPIAFPPLFPMLAFFFNSALNSQSSLGLLPDLTFLLVPFDFSPRCGQLSLTALLHFQLIFADSIEWNYFVFTFLCTFIFRVAMVSSVFLSPNVFSDFRSFVVRDVPCCIF